MLGKRQKPKRYFVIIYYAHTGVAGIGILN